MRELMIMRELSQESHSTISPGKQRITIIFVYTIILLFFVYIRVCARLYQKKKLCKKMMMEKKIDEKKMMEKRL